MFFFSRLRRGGGAAKQPSPYVLTYVLMYYSVAANNSTRQAGGGGDWGVNWCSMALGSVCYWRLGACTTDHWGFNVAQSVAGAPGLGAWSARLVGSGALSCPPQGTRGRRWARLPLAGSTPSEVVEIARFRCLIHQFVAGGHNRLVFLAVR